MGLFKIVEFPAHMRPASRFLNASRFVDLLEPGVTIRLQSSLELAQVCLRVFSLAIRRVGEPYRRWCLVSRRPIIAHVGPQSSRFGFSISGRQHWNWRVIGMQLLCRHHVTSQMLE